MADEQQPQYVSLEEFAQLRDRVAGINGNLGQVRDQVTQIGTQVQTGFSQLTNLFAQQPQPQIQAPAPQAAPTQQPARADAAQVLQQRVDRLEQEVIPSLLRQARTSTRLIRLNNVAPELASNQAILDLVTQSELADEALFASIAQLQSMFAPPPSSDSAGDAASPAPPAPATGQPAAAPQPGNPLSSLGQQSQPGLVNGDIPEGVPPVNQPFTHAGETLDDQMMALIQAGDQDGLLRVLESAINTDQLSVGRTFGQHRRSRAGVGPQE